MNCALIPCEQASGSKAAPPIQSWSAAFTFVEVMVSLALLGVGLAGLWTGLGQCLRISRAHLETIAATECLAQRVEQARAAGWSAVLNSEGVRDQILSVPSANAGSLPNLEERITVTPYPAVTPAPTPIVVLRDATGLVSVVSQPAGGFDLRTILAVRIDFSATWQDHQSNKQHDRELSTVIAVQGLIR
jgi:prepilin-type N-terminal cleavage/methylation domain-containing protein